jgi:phospholipid-binding lipoprotein MlaA
MTPIFLNVVLLLAGQPLRPSELMLPAAGMPVIEPMPMPTLRTVVEVPPLRSPITNPAPEPDKGTPIMQADPEGSGTTPSAQDDDATPGELGEIVVSGRRRSGDPIEKVNAQSYKAVQALDGAIVAPLAKGYEKAVPKPVRRGIHNFLDNLQEPVVFLNYILQLKPGKAAETLGRFAVNSTVGLAGIVDVAKKKPFNLPHRPNSLANTLGYYGVGPGPYLFLPLIGPTTLRDLFGTVGDRLVLPTAVGAPFNKSAFTIPANVLSALDYRVAFDESLSKLHSAPNPYAATRTNYLERRRADIDRLHSPKWRARHSAVASCPVIVPAASTCASTDTIGTSEKTIASPLRP